MRIFSFFVISLLLTLSLPAVTYEDGEDKKTNRWYPLKPSEATTIENIYDEVKGSHVIRLQGDGTRSAYILMTGDGSTWNNKKEKVLHWQMNYSEDFVILVSLETKRGKRYLIYTPGSEDGYMQYGLGDNVTHGGWHRYSRDLEKDLRYFDSKNSIERVNSFVIRGSGAVDNIKLLKTHRLEREDLKKSKVISKKKVSRKRALEKKKKFQRSVKKRSITRRKNSIPQIIMEGENPLFLSVGEAFMEPGVHAMDKEDGQLVVTSSENIDKHKEGIYSVIYMATDNDGNSAIDKRYVHIGEVLDEDTKSGSDSMAVEESNSTEVSSSEDDDNEYKLEERELEIAEWEKELQLREKEISQREQNMQKSGESEN